MPFLVFGGENGAVSHALNVLVSNEEEVWLSNLRRQQSPACELAGMTGIHLPGVFFGMAEHAAEKQLRGYYPLKTDLWGIGATLHNTAHFKSPIQQHVKSCIIFDELKEQGGSWEGAVQN
jgi:hypothetical protein